MHHLFALLLWPAAAAATIDRTRSNADMKTLIDELPSTVEGSTLQNTEDELLRRKRQRVHKNLFDNTVVPNPRIINGVSVSSYN